LLTLTAFVAATACGGDDDDAPAPAAGASGKAGSGGGGKAGSGSGGKAGASATGGSSGASEAGETSVGGTGEGGAAESPLAARGDYLVNHVAACPDCHTPRNEMGAPIMEKYMSGAECFVKLPTGECLHSKNLTSDVTGLKNYSDDAIKDMIRNGMETNANGDQRPLNPVMPYYVFHNITDDDMNAIVAFLRTIPAVEHDVPASDDVFAVPNAATPLSDDDIPSPPTDFAERESALRGRYLAAQAGVCVECHTQHDMTADKVLKLDQMFAGGESFDVGLPNPSVSANLTSDDDTGLGKWTTDQIMKALLQGLDDEDMRLCPPMPAGPMGAFGGLTQGDALDIANYIKSLPAISNQIDDMCSLPAQ
jgi:hypothetical protein